MSKSLLISCEKYPTTIKTGGFLSAMFLKEFFSHVRRLALLRKVCYSTLTSLGRGILS
jgi:hypothetical protein